MTFLLLLLLATVTNSTKTNDTLCSCNMEATMPVPDFNEKTLFHVQRSPNHNTIGYDLNLVNGHLDMEEPVHPYWIRYQENGERKELSYIQEHFAYGLNAKKISNDRFEIRFVSYKKLPLYLEKSARDHGYHLVTTINGKSIEIKHVFVQIEGGSFWFPKVTCIQVTGIDPHTGTKSVQFFKPQ